ncbi:hypothetical protein FACS1894217_12740 [Clostridia bacterium]|nr:hypothetical protein FACS1894217_12740 [Clostridia bacterium]
MKQPKALSVIIGVLGLVAAILPLTIYHLVETAGGMEGMHMAMDCQAACTAEVFVGAAIAAIAVLSLFIKDLKISLGGSALLLVGGVSAIAVPNLIGFCKSEEMACRYITQPTLTVIGVLIIALSLGKIATGIIALRRSAVQHNA